PKETARLQFNWYAEFLSNLLLIKVISYVLYLSILGHALMALWIGIQSRKAQGKTRYAYDRRAGVTAWYHRHMELLGVVLLLFIIIHMKDFWFVFQFGALPLDQGGHKDLYEIVVQAFGQLWYVVLYVISVIALGYHLLHGFFAAFRSLGLFHSKFSRWVYYFGWFYTLVMTLGFSIIPIYIYFTQS
ncbi:MAG: succinate dehydrogenase cytochrome b subunit, partial [Bacteroidota bacterium]